MKFKFIRPVMVLTALLGSIHLEAQTPHPAPPAEPRIKPIVSLRYPEDSTGRHITDTLFTRMNATNAAGLNVRVKVELVFTRQVTQAQIDQFIAMGGEITYLYQSVAYGWDGSIPLGQVRGLPQAMGSSLALVKEPRPIKMHLYNATQTGRVRGVWTNFAGSVTGYEGSTNITIAITDTGVDVTHTDLAGRMVYWKDWSGTGYTTGTDYDGHGTHVAGIALGSGAAGGSAAGPLYFTQFGNMSNAANGTFSAFFIALPESTTWLAGAKWTNGASSALYIYDRFNFDGTYEYISAGSGAKGASPLSCSGTISSPGSDVYTSALIKTNITSFVITNELVSYPASPDGFNRFRGVAPGCNWAGEKVCDDEGNSEDSWLEEALDDLVTLRTNYNIKVINISLGVVGSPGIDTTLRNLVNSTVQNGIMVVAAAGNDSGNNQISDPGRAAYALTVGAMNASNTLTSYTSEGFTSPDTSNLEDYKPDLLAPGGSEYTGYILSTDSNDGDGTSLSDQKANDYTPLQGTSMATPFVAGSAALVIDALQKNGLTWDFNSATDPIYVKMLLCATATESNKPREGNEYNPTLERATANGSGYPVGKDIYEGYGVLNPDAAVEAGVLWLTNGVLQTNTLGTTFSTRRAWARKLSLSAYVPEILNLNVPVNGDFDLYLYSTNTGAYGAPIILASSTSAGTNTDEAITFNSITNQGAILVVKWVSGYGAFSLTASNTPDDNFVNAYALSNSTSGYSPGNNTGYTTESGEPNGGGSGKTAWYSWTSTYTGKASFMTTLGVVKMYAGTAVSALTAATSQFSGNVASNNFLVTAGTAYHVSVDSTGGAYTLAWSYQGVPNLIFTNSTLVTLPSSSGASSPYPLTNFCSGIPGTIVSVTTTISGITTADFTYPKFLLAGPSTNVSLKGFMGNGVPVTNLSLTFGDSGTNMDFTTSYSGAFLPTDPLNAAVSYDSPAPGKSYSTNFDDFVGTSASGTWSLYVDMDGNAGATGSVTNWLLTIHVASAPVVTINTNTITYSDSTGVINLTATATITDADNWDFSGGSLAVQISGNAATEDQLIVNPQGAGSGQIGVSGSAISYSGTNFGYYTGGASGSVPLVVYFTNSVASFAAVEALFTCLAYTNAVLSSTNQRTVTFTLNDGLYGTNVVSKLVNVTVANHAPTVANSIPNQTATYGASFSYIVPSNTFTDSDAGQTLTCTASGSLLGTASGISFTSATRTFSATTIDSGSGGVIVGGNTISVIATDNGTPSKSATNNFTLTVNKASASITPAAATRTYGATNPVFTGTLGGFVAADSINGVYSTTATTNTGAGAASITATLSDPHNDAGNYTVTTNTGTLTINKAALIVAAANATRSYGSTNPTFTVAYNGLTNGQTFASSGITGSPALATAATTNTAPGNYVITNLTGTLASANYAFTLSNATLTVTSAVLTVTVSNVSRVYGGANPGFGVSYSGFTNGQTLATSDVTGAPSLTTLAATNSSVGGYTMTNSIGTLSSVDYSFSLANGTLAVTQAMLTVSASNAFRPYGGNNPTFGVAYAGFTNGQTLATSGMTGTPALTTAATTNSPAGAYPITNSLGTLASANYSFALTNGTLTVTSGVVTVTADAQSRIYGTTNPIFTATYTGFTNGQNFASSGITGSPSLATAAITNSPVGAYVITNSPGTLAAPNYSFALSNGTLTVSPAALAITVSNASRAYGVTNPVFTGALTGLVNHDNVTAGYSTLATTNSPSGSYPIVSVLTDPGSRLGNYAVTTNTGLLTISNATLLVSASNATRAYGAANPSFSVNYSGFANGETASSGTVTGSPALITSAATNSFIGNYVITNGPGTLASPDYSFILSNGTLSVTQAPLTVSPANAARAYGQTNPVLTGTISGIVNQDSISAAYRTTSLPSSPVGAYPITATLLDPNSVLGNYTLTTNQALLTVTNASGLSNYLVSILVSNSIIELATNVTLNFTFTDPNSGLAMVAAVTMTPYSASNAAPTFSLLDFYGGPAGGMPVHMAVDSGLSGGDGNWFDYFEGANFSASLVSASPGINTNSIEFGIAGIGFRSNAGYPAIDWTSSAVTNVFRPNADGLYEMDTNPASLFGANYAGALRSGNLGYYQLSDDNTESGRGIVLQGVFTEGNYVVSGGPAMLSFVSLTNNQVQFAISGTTGASYIVQAATNLASGNWLPVATNTVPFVFAETNYGAYAQRYYRVVAQ